MRAVRIFHAAACAGSLALAAMAPCSFGQTQQEDAATSTTVQQQGPTVEDLQRQIDELQKQVNILKNRGAENSAAHVVGTEKTAAPESAAGSSSSTAASSSSVAAGSTSSSSVAVSPATVAASAEPKTPGAKNPHSEPFAFADFTWLNGNARTKDTPYATNFFTPEVRADVSYAYDFRHPADDTIVGSSEVFRAQEVVLTDLAVGGDFHMDHVRARILSQFGLYSTATPRNDASTARGQWDLANAYRYLSEANAGYHFDVQHGLNVDAGIFLSYVGLFSFYQFDNWAYQPSYVSSNTPWFFTGVRIQIFPTEHLKIEPWIINGWQSYASANSRKGLGGQVRYTPRSWVNIISNNYGLGHDDLYLPKRGRLHTDDSIEIKYYDRPENTLDKMAFTFTGDLGCEFGNGVSCHGDTAGGPKQSFIGFML